MRTNLKRFAALIGMATVASAVAVIPNVSPASAAPDPLPPGSASSGAVTLNPSSGTSNTGFQIVPPVGADCPGAGADNWRYHTYITPKTNDPSQVVFNVQGTPGPLPTANLRNASGSQLRNLSPAIGNNFLAQQTVSFTSGAFGAANLPPGEYWVGFACTVTDDVTFEYRLREYWATGITITAQTGAGTNNFVWSVGTRPSAPVLASPLTAGDGTLSGTFTVAAADPAITAITVTAQPQPSGTPVVLDLAPGATSFNFTGLTNGTAYSVTATATNSIGASVASNAVVGTPSPGAIPAPTVTVVPGVGTCAVTWTDPTSPVAETGYVVSGTPGGLTFNAPSGTLTNTFTGLTAGTVYSFTVQAQYPAPYVGTASAPVTCTPTAAQVILQDITVTRPVGQLVLTQRCGVYGPALAAPAVDAFPGFPKALIANDGTADQIGTAPIDTDTGLPDTAFGEYPYPASPNYPTKCGVSLGTGALIQTGALRGQYYTAEGFLNQVTVADLRDSDPGWTLNGTLTNFTASSGSFDGDYLGWTPKVNDTSPTTTTGYTQTVTAGAEVLPGTGVTSGTGLTSGKTLASAPVGNGTIGGLGIAELDARLRLLIPVTAPAGDYTATLTLSFV